MVQSVPFNKPARYRKPHLITFQAFRNTCNPHDVVIADRWQNPAVAKGKRWNFYATFATPLKATVAFGVHDTKQRRQRIHSHGYN